MVLDEFLALPKSGVIILQKGNSVLVSYTTSMGAELLDLYTQFSGHTGIDLKVVSVGADIETLKLHTEYYRHYYLTRGMSSLIQYNRKTIKYKVRVIPNSDFRYVDVELVSARGDSKVVGRFESAIEAKDFVDMYYGLDNPFRFPVYAINSTTKGLLASVESGLLKLK